MLYVPSLGNVCRSSSAATRAEWQTFESMVLPQLRRHEERFRGQRHEADAPTATELIFCASARYRSISVGDIRWTPAMLSKP